MKTASFCEVYRFGAESGISRWRKALRYVGPFENVPEPIAQCSTGTRSKHGAASKGACCEKSAASRSIDVAAPGGDQRTGSANGVLSTLNDGYSSPGSDSYSYYQGTSMAAPHVVGVAALMLARNPTLTPDEVEVLLKTTARAFPRACAVGCGKGIVNATAAVNAVFVGASLAGDSAEAEPNNTRLQPQTLSSFPVKVAGTISAGTDMDVYKIHPRAKRR